MEYSYNCADRALESAIPIVRVVHRDSTKDAEHECTGDAVANSRLGIGDNFVHGVLLKAKTVDPEHASVGEGRSAVGL